MKDEKTSLDKKIIKEMVNEEDKDVWLEIPEEGIQITMKQQHNGKTYAEILKEVNEKEIADYPLLQRLRNKLAAGDKRFKFLKEFWVFIPNPDIFSKKNNYVAWFYADPADARFNCSGHPDVAIASLGCFIVRKLKNKK